MWNGVGGEVAGVMSETAAIVLHMCSVIGEAVMVTLIQCFCYCNWGFNGS